MAKALFTLLREAQGERILFPIILGRIKKSACHLPLVGAGPTARCQAWVWPKTARVRGGFAARLPLDSPTSTTDIDGNDRFYKRLIMAA